MNLADHLQLHCTVKGSISATGPVAAMALILGIDRFMSMFRALINMVGNGVATVVARWEHELDRKALREQLA